MAQVKKCDCCGRTGYELEDEKKPFKNETFSIKHKDHDYNVTVDVVVEWSEDVKDHCNDCEVTIAAKAIAQAHEATRPRRAKKQPKGGDQVGEGQDQGNADAQAQG